MNGKVSARTVKAAMALIVVGLAPVCAASLISYNGDFTTVNQSIWASGPAFVSDNNSQYILPIGGSASAGGFTRGTGAQVSVTASGEFILDNDVKLSGGSVSAAVPFSFNLSAPTQAVSGTYFTVSSPGGVVFKPGGSLNTTGFSVQASTDLNAYVYLDANGSACGTGTCVSFDKSATINQTFPLLSLNQNNNGAFEFLNTVFDLGAPEHILIPAGDDVVDFGTLQVNAPYGPSTQGSGVGTIDSFGQVHLASYNLDVGNLAASLAEPPIPPLNATIGLPSILGVTFPTATYNLLTSDIGWDLFLSEDFDLETHISAYLQVLETGQVIPLNAGSPVSIFMPANETDLHIRPVFTMDATLTNLVDMCLQPSIYVSVLSASVDAGSLGSASVGPLWDLSKSFGCLGGPPFGPTIVDNSFSLGGFNTIYGQTIVVDAVPEPATFVLTGLVVLALPVLRRKRRMFERAMSGRRRSVTSRRTPPQS